jgi:hypothetical protein
MEPTGALMEAFQRRQGGMSIGQPPPQLPAQEQGLPQSMSQGGIDQLKKSAPGEAEIIIKALIQRLKSLGERGE